MNNTITDLQDLPRDVTPIPIMSSPSRVANTDVVSNSSRVAIPGNPINPFDPHRPLAVNDHDPLYLNAPRTWAERNPTIGVQKQRLRAPLTDAAKATKHISAKVNKAHAALLSADIDKLLGLQQREIEKIAMVHSQKGSDIEKLINNSTNYKVIQAPSLANALTYKKRKELNEGILCD